MGWPLALAVGISAPGLAQTLPQGGNVVGGAGTIQQTAPNQLTINQATQNLAIDWQSFSIGANNIVRFVQPSTSAVALNRVLNGDPSQIYGQIQANGQVVIMSPNGIVFGPNSRVDVNALVATTANISTVDFMAGKLLFDQASSDANARVVNQGVISVAQGGFAVLAAASVSNQGQIIANGGTVVLGGTKTFAIDFHGDGLLKFAATGVVDQKPAGADALVENSGSIEANGGRVLLTARAARSVLDNVINTTGIVVAKTASLVNGEIVIDGGDSGIVHVAGTLDASGAAAGETGGTVKVLGEKVGLFENARIDASGNAGGGMVLVGGNYQGKGPEANAQYLYMDARAVIDASSASGDGGRVILWSDLATRNAGRINVSGARNGGFVEVSSKGFLDFRGTVDLRGLAGRAGSLLLDPTDITINNSDFAIVDSDPSATAALFENSTPSNAASSLSVATLLAALASGDVTISTATGATAGIGDITVASVVNYTGASPRTLTLLADRNITVNASVTATGTGALNLLFNARANNGAEGAIKIQPTSAGGLDILTNGGYLVMGGGSTLASSIVATGGTVMASDIALSTSAAVGGSLSGSTGINIITSNSYSGSVTISTVGTTADGDLLMNGRGGAVLGNSVGVRIDSSASSGSYPSDTVSISTGVGQINIIGTGGTYTNGNMGVSIVGRASASIAISNTSGDMRINGTGGLGSSSVGTRLQYLNLAMGLNGTYPYRRITGTATAGNNAGISLEGSAVLSSNDDGSFVLWGVGAGTQAGIVSSGTGNQLNAGPGGLARLSADSLSLDSGFSGTAGTGGVFGIQAITTVSTVFNYSSAAPDTASLYVTSALLGAITAPTVSIGTNAAPLATTTTTYLIPDNTSLILAGSAITMNGNIYYGNTGTGSLTLSSDSNLSIDWAIGPNTGVLNVNLSAPTASVAINALVATNGGILSIAAGAGVTQTAAINASGAAGSLVLDLVGGASTTLTNSSNKFNALSVTSTGTGAVSLRTAAALNLQTSTMAGGSLDINAGSNPVTLSGTNNLGNSFSITTSGNVTIKGTLTVDVLDLQSGVTGDILLGASNVPTTTITTTASLLFPIFNSGTPQSITLHGNTVLQPGQDFSPRLPIDGAYALTIAAATGNVTIDKSIGVGTALAGLTVSAASGQILVYGGAPSSFFINTSGAAGQTYTAQAFGMASFLDLNSNGNAITFNTRINAMTGGGYLTVDHGVGTLSFNANIGDSPTLGGAFGSGAAPPLTALTTVGMGSVFLPAIVSTQNQIYIEGAASRTGNIDFSTQGGSISLMNAANSFVSGNVGFAIVGGGGVNFAAANPTSFGAISVGGFQAVVTDSVTFNAPISVPGFNVTSTGATANIAFQNSASVTVSGGNSSLISDRGISISTAITTNGGDIVVLGGGATWPGAPYGAASFAATPTGNFVGVAIGAGGSISAGVGSVAIAGEGGNNAAGSQHGVHLTAAAQISGASVSISGQGGNSTGAGNMGVYIQSGSIVEAGGGGLVVVGAGGGAGGSTNNTGVLVQGGIVRTPSFGTLDVTGTGGLIGSGVVVTATGGAIRAANGALTVTGTGTGARSGVELTNVGGTGIIEATGYGSVSVFGTGGTGAGTGAHGINLDGAGQIRSNSAALALNGTGGTVAAASHGIYLANGAVVAAQAGATSLQGAATNGSGIATGGSGWTIGSNVATGDITISTDTAAFSTTGASIQTAGQVRILPITGGTSIGIGGGAGLLQLPANMGFIDADVLVVGTSTSGNLTVGSGGISMANATDLALFGANIALNGNVTLGSGPGGDLLTLNVGTGGTVTQGAASNIVVESMVLFGTGDFTLTRDGSLYNTIDHVVATSVGNLSLRANSTTGTVLIATETINTFPYAGVTATSFNLATTGGIGQMSGAYLNVGGGATSFTAGSGGIVLTDMGNSFGGSLAVETVGVVTLSNAGGTLLGNISASGGFTLQSDGAITQSGGTTIVGGANSSFTASGSITLTNSGNDLSAVSLTTTASGAASYTDSNVFALGNSNVSGNLTLVSGGAFTQSGTVTAGGKYDLTTNGNTTLNTATVGGPLIVNVTGGTLGQSGAMSVAGIVNASATGGIALANVGNAFQNQILLTSTGGSVAVANAGTTLFGNIASNGTLAVSVTGGTLSQTNGTTIATTGNATVTLAGAYAMTLTEAGNIFGGTLTLTGTTGAVNGTAGGAVTATAGSFTFNSAAVPIVSATPPANNTTAPAPGAGAGGTTVSSALTDVAPVSQIQAAAALPPPPPIVVSSTSVLALLTAPPPVADGGGGAQGPAPGPGPGAPVVAGGPAAPGGPGEGGDAGPAVSPVGVVVAPPPPPPPAAAGGPPPPAAQGAPPPPAIVLSSGPTPTGPGAVALVPTSAPPPPASAVGNVGGASAPAVNGGASLPQSSTPRTAVSMPFPVLPPR